MKMKITSIVFTALTLVALTAVNAVSENLENSARQMLIERDKQIKELLGPKGTEFSDEVREQVKDIINDVIDYRAMAAHALQSTWDELSEDKKNEFVDVFSTIVRDQSLNSLDIYRAEVTYEEFEIDGNVVRATTIATLENVRTPVIYVMEKRGDEWFVVDMSVDNVSTADSYRRSFQNIIRRRGYDALLANLKRRAGEA
jgi:phospholipid transport system substrate-binding protein